MRAIALSDWLAQRLNRENGTPLYRQLYRLLQEAILSQKISSGSKMPSSRLLATELRLGRNTVTQVYEQLALEGYVSAASGKGTFVADTYPNEGFTGQVPHQNEATVIDISPQLSLRGEQLVTDAGVSPRQSGAFMPGVPDVSRFPSSVWSRLHTKHWRRIQPSLLTYASPGGFVGLRRALAEYLRTARSVQCTPEQIIITTGIHQSIDLSVRLLTDSGDAIWTENPCYWGVRSILQISGLNIISIPVDDEGMDPSLKDLESPPKLILVTPSHQYPLGMVMSLARRRRLLEYARKNRCWIVEDDYDSEFRYSSRPLASLQGLDEAGRVIYVGSFGKTLFPGLRIGYVVVPQALSASFGLASAELYREGQMLQQAVLADFIDEGHLTSHIRRMRGIYAQRRELMLRTIADRYGDRFKIEGGDAGLHLVLRFPKSVDDKRIAASALTANIVVRPLSRYFAPSDGSKSGLLIGYASVPNEEIKPAFEVLARIIDSVMST